MSPQGYHQSDSRRGYDQRGGQNYQRNDISKIYMMQGDRNQQQMMEMVGSGSQQSLQYQKRLQNHSPSNVELNEM